MTSIQEFMEQDHRQCDAHLNHAERAVHANDWTAARQHYQKFSSAVLSHFKAEEKVLFVELEKAQGSIPGPVQVMLNEHQQIRTQLEKMARAIEKQDDRPFASLGQSLHILIQQHNMKEEQILYHLADNILEDNQAQILKRIQEHMQSS